MTVIVEYDPKPIPIRDYDWTAVEPGYEPGAPIGYGRTYLEAVSDLRIQIRERDDLCPWCGSSEPYIARAPGLDPSCQQCNGV